MTFLSIYDNNIINGIDRMNTIIEFVVLVRLNYHMLFFFKSRCGQYFDAINCYGLSVIVAAILRWAVNFTVNFYEIACRSRSIQLSFHRVAGVSCIRSHEMIGIENMQVTVKRISQEG